MEGTFRRVWVAHNNTKADNRSIVEPSITLFVSNIAENVTPRVLWETFEKYGRLVEVCIPKKVDSRNRRFGFVRFKLEWEAYKAARLTNKSIVQGKRISVNVARFPVKNAMGRPHATRSHIEETSHTEDCNMVEVEKRGYDVVKEWVSNSVKESFDEAFGKLEWKELPDKNSGVLSKIISELEELKTFLSKLSYVSILSEISSETSSKKNSTESPLLDMKVKHTEGSAVTEGSGPGAVTESESSDKCEESHITTQVAKVVEGNGSIRARVHAHRNRLKNIPGQWGKFLNFKGRISSKRSRKIKGKCSKVKIKKEASIKVENLSDKKHSADAPIGGFASGCRRLFLEINSLRSIEAKEDYVVSCRKMLDTINILCKPKSTCKRVIRGATWYFLR